MEDVEELNMLHTSIKKHNDEIDTIFVNALESFIKIGFDANCKIIFSISPVVNNIPEQDNKSFRLIKKIAKKHNIPVLNYLRNEHFKGNYKLYKDKSHLNINGATYYSSMVAHDIKKLLQSKKQ
jgi:lysophospholipase L1-like esterase